jgi:hypothetical protein
MYLYLYERGKQQKCPIQTASVWTKMWTNELLNTKPECYPEDLNVLCYLPINLLFWSIGQNSDKNKPNNKHKYWKNRDYNISKIPQQLISLKACVYLESVQKSLRQYLSIHHNHRNLTSSISEDCTINILHSLQLLCWSRILFFSSSSDKQYFVRCQSVWCYLWDTMMNSYSDTGSLALRKKLVVCFGSDG